MTFHNISFRLKHAEINKLFNLKVLILKFRTFMLQSKDIVFLSAIGSVSECSRFRADAENLSCNIFKNEFEQKREMKY